MSLDRSKLAMLARKRRDDMDMSDLVLSSMGRTMSKLAMLHEMAGESLDPTVCVGDMVISMKRDQTMSWRGRMLWLATTAQSIAPKCFEDPAEVFGEMMCADGWVVGHGTVKTPAWMNRHVELEIEAVLLETGIPEEWLR